MARLISIHPTLGRIRPVLKPPIKLADPFYASSEWRAFSRAVKIERGWRCENCGKDCRENPAELIADHIVERKDGGRDFSRRNIELLCIACHNRKTARVRAARADPGRR